MRYYRVNSLLTDGPVSLKCLLKNGDPVNFHSSE